MKLVASEAKGETRLLEMVMRAAFQITEGCHHGNKTPRFSHVVVTSDKYYFYVQCSRKHFFGIRWALPKDVTVKRLMADDVVQTLAAAIKRPVDVHLTDEGELFYRVTRLIVQPEPAI